jgi:hypothetical protein
MSSNLKWLSRPPAPPFMLFLPVSPDLIDLLPNPLNLNLNFKHQTQHVRTRRAGPYRHALGLPLTFDFPR